MFGNEIQRITARKDEYHEVEEFICNTCSFDKKEVSDWVVEGPRKFEKESVINQGKYYGKRDTVVINTEKGILQGRDIDRKKISMAEIDYNEKIDGNPINIKKNG
jgi:NADH-quinone oxidoreductase subunit G